MKYTVFDVEADGLLEVATKIHCLSYEIYEGKDLLYQGSITGYDQMLSFLLNQELLVGHNITLYDIPLVEKILGITLNCGIIDTLGVSWHLSPIKGFLHGLEAWGERFGYPKVKIDDWESLTVAKYIERCERDVLINRLLFHEMMDYLMEIYEGFDQVQKLLDYIAFKMDCLLEQQNSGITLDNWLAEESKFNLEYELDDKVKALGEVMPPVLEKEIPKKMTKKDGSVSAIGKKWYALLEEKGLPSTSTAIYKKGNPGSNKQLKEWLFSIGWEPETFKVSNNTGQTLPQVSLPHGQGLCPSVLALQEKHPAIEHLKGLYVIKHRLGLFKSFLENVNDEGEIFSRAQGFTNTFRLQHAKPIANLPGVDKFYGKEIRGCLKVKNDDYEMIGSDVSGLEDSTKMHYMYFYDPGYVEKMQTPGFDGHTNVAVFTGMMTVEEENFFKTVTKRKEEEGDDFTWINEEEKLEYERLAKIRKKAKPVNFGGQYGIGPPTLAKQMGISLVEAEELHRGYWQLNWSIKQTAKDAKIKTVRGQKWLYNPVSGFWMFLKEDKDKFSTLNQSTGVYVFDTWVKHTRKRLKQLGIPILLQYHDEILLQYLKQMRETVRGHLLAAMKEANEELKLNVTVRVSVDVGKNYAECH